MTSICPELVKQGITQSDCEGAKETCCACSRLKCWYDLSKVEKNRLATASRDNTVKELWKKGKTRSELAEKFGLSEWTIGRILKR